jgi:hypothetical protein
MPERGECGGPILAVFGTEMHKLGKSRETDQPAYRSGRIVPRVRRFISPLAKGGLTGQRLDR